VNAIPTITGTTPASRCSTGTVALGATASAGTINWYAAATGGASLGTGTTFTTPSISATTTYYADATSNGCNPPSRTAILATVLAIPVISSQQTVTASYNTNATANALSVTATTATGTISEYQWYSNSSASISGATLIDGATDASFVPPTSVSGTRYYYCKVTNSNDCSVNSVVSGAINTLVTPVITSVIPTTPLVSDQPVSTGYRGQRVTVNGNNFMNNSTVSYNGVTALSVVFVNSGQLTAIVNNSGINSAGNVLVTNPSTGASCTASFRYIGYYTATNGDWNTTAAWLGATLPTNGSDATIAHSTTVNSAVSSRPEVIFIRTGATLTVGNAAGTLATNDLSNKGTLAFTAAGTVSIGDAFTLTADAIFTAGTGNMRFTNDSDQVLFSGKNSLAFNNLLFSGIGNKRLQTGASMSAHNLTVGTGSGFILTESQHEIAVSGDLSIQGNMEPGRSNFSFSGTGNQRVSAIGSGRATFNNLSLDKPSGTLLLDNNVQVTDTLFMLRGSINTQTYLLEIGRSATENGIISHTDGFISGRLRRWYSNTTKAGNESGIFPMGQFVSNTWKNRHVVLNYSNAPSIAGHITVEFIAEPMINGGIGDQYFIEPGNTGGAGFTVTNFSNNGFWKIDNLATTLTDGEYTISLTGEGFGIPGGMNEITMVKRVSGGNWFCPGRHQPLQGSVNVPTVTRSKVTGFSNFGFAGGVNNALPISLISFDATCDGNSVIVDWTTASEANNKEFHIEESKDGITWTTAKTIAGAGNSNSIRHYQEQIKPGFSGSGYMRLSQVDYNGDSETFDPVFVTCEESRKNEVKIFPNPTADYANVELTASEDFKVHLTVFSSSGQILLSTTSNLQAGKNLLRLDVTSLPPGSYYLNLKYDKEVKVTGGRTLIKL